MQVTDKPSEVSIGFSVRFLSLMFIIFSIVFSINYMQLIDLNDLAWVPLTLTCSPCPLNTFKDMAGFEHLYQRSYGDIYSRL